MLSPSVLYTYSCKANLKTVAQNGDTAAKVGRVVSCDSCPASFRKPFILKSALYAAKLKNDRLIDFLIY